MEFMEALAFAKEQHIMKRRLMEAQGGVEMRRLHIIYFLSRKGHIEQPHLIRVHLSRNCVRLRDVKRWLSELRGKEMPDSFAWSFKRRYKTGYVWQDLVDEDLITPISDNEYVLKGSEISSTTFNITDHANGEKKISMQKQPHLEDDSKDQNLSKQTIKGHPDTTMDFPTKPSCEIEEQSPPVSSETSTLTDDSSKLEEDQKHLERTKQETQKHGNKTPTFHSTLLNKKNNVNLEKISTTSTHDSFMSWGFPSGASQMLRNLINCRAVETNESAMVMMNRRNKASLNGSSNEVYGKSAKIVKGEKFGGSQRIFGTPWNQKHQNSRKSWDGVKEAKKKKKKSEFSDEKTVSSDAYKPVNRQNCSQCGKSFEPDKMQTHMISCKGMKALVNGVSSSDSIAEKKAKTSICSSSYQDSVTSLYLMNN